MAATAWYNGNTMLIELGADGAPLTDETSGDIITTADVNVTVVDRAGDELVGQTWPVAVPHVQNGFYQVAIPYAIGPGKGNPGTATITADIDGARGRWDIPVLGTAREG